MSIARRHAEWLSLVEVSGPFLSMPVLLEAFPQGLEAHDPDHHRLLRLAHDEWEAKASDPATHNAWVRFVLRKTLDFAAEALLEGLRVQGVQNLADAAQLRRPAGEAESVHQLDVLVLAPLTNGRGTPGTARRIIGVSSLRIIGPGRPGWATTQVYPARLPSTPTPLIAVWMRRNCSRLITVRFRTRPTGLSSSFQDFLY